MADANVRINVETASLADLNAKLETLTAEIKKVPVGSAEFKKLSAEIRRVDGAVESANRKLKSLDVGAIAGDIAKLGGAVASASALFKQFSAEGSDSQEAIQSALETTNTILGAGAIAEGVASAARLAGVVATNAASAAQATYAAVVGTSTGALKAFKVALLATGIGAFVVLIGELVANWEKLIPTVKSSAQTIKEFGETVQSELLSIEGLLSDLEFSFQEKLAKGFSLQDIFADNKTAIDNYIKELERLGKEATNLSISASFDAFQYEQKLRDQGVEEEKIAEDEKLKKLKQSADEAEKISNDLDTKLGNARLRRIKLDKDLVNERIAGYELEAQNRALLAKDDEAQLVQIEKDLQKKKLDELKAAGIFSQQEIQKQQNAYQKALNEEQAYLKKVNDEKIKAERDYYNTRASLLDVTYEERLKTINRNQEEELKTIKKTGLSAAEIQSKTQELELRYSFDRVNLIAEEEKKKLDLVRKSVTDRLELQKKAAETAGDVEEVKKIQEAIKAVNEQAQQAINEANTLATQRLEELFKAGKITEEAYKEAVKKLKQINTELGTEIKKTTTEGGEAIVSSAIDNVIGKFDTVLNETITNLGIAGDEAEKEFLKSITGKRGGEVEKAQEEFLKKQIANRKAVAKATIQSTDEEIKALEGLTNLSAKEEEDRSKKILELRAKRSKAEVDLAKTTAEEENKILQDRQDKIVKFFEDIQAIYTQVAEGIYSLGQILADQAALQDLRFEEELQAVDERYQREFELIDEREKKFEDELAARDGQLTAEERKRRAFAKERADLEKQQQAEIADLEAQRANAAADAAIKQANLNFALAIGQITIDSALAIARQFKDLPLPAAIPAAALTALLTGVQIAAASSARSTAIAQAEASRPGVSGAKNVRVSKADGGLITGPGNGVSDSIPANLSNGEFVVNANATSRYLPLLTQINQSGLQGGNPVNPTSFSDPAMLELLARIDDKLSQPTRSYVVATDIEEIKNKQLYINRRSNVL